jgi:hypothetical protein
MVLLLCLPFNGFTTSSIGLGRSSCPRNTSGWHKESRPSAGGHSKSRTEPTVVIFTRDTFGVGVNYQSTPIASRNTKGGMYLARRAVEQSARIRGKPLPARSEAEDSAREDNDAQSSEVEGEEIMLTIAEMKGFTQALMGAVQMMNALIKKMNLDREKNDSIREINNVIRGIVSSMDQCMGQTNRKRKTKTKYNKFEEVRQSTVKQVAARAVDVSREDMYKRAAGDYSKRKMESPGKGRKVIMAKRPRKGEPTFAGMCIKAVDNKEANREWLEDSEGWTTVSRRKRETRRPDGVPYLGTRASDGRERK